MIKEFDEIDVSIRFLNEGINASGSLGKMVVTILSAVVKLEGQRILECTNEGQLEAKSKSVKFDREPCVHKQEILSFSNECIGVSKIARILVVPHFTQ